MDRYITITKRKSSTRTSKLEPNPKQAKKNPVSQNRFAILDNQESKEKPAKPVKDYKPPPLYLREPTTNVLVNKLSQLTHHVSNCKSNNNCLICDNRHHTMLHQEPIENSNVEWPTTSSGQSSAEVLRPTNSSPTYQRPSTSTNVTQTRQVFHTRQNQSVILGTASVNIIHNGNRYQVRALIDSASECSFVSNRLRKRFKLPTHSANAKVSGVNNAVSVVSRKACSLKIGSDLDSSVVLNTTAFVLADISENLPSISVNADIKGLLPNLHLADSNPFHSRPVDILIGADLYPQIMLPEIRRDVLGSLLAQRTIFGWILTGPVNST
ncbi:uncharacterized protein LOC135961211 [Calliphora vicina]|uniref:uncharacterized protein LOC135961211 n=1 Tax=Calliphora vicina TaxID=7373 RepID=UPI00325C219F